MPKKGPELVQVDNGLKVVVLPDVEVPHTHLQGKNPAIFIECMDAIGL